MKVSVNSITNNIVRPLLDAGAKHILVASVAPIEMAPYTSFNQPEENPAFVEKVKDTLNRHVKEALETIECEEDVNIMYSVDAFPDSDQIREMGLQIESSCTIGFNGIPVGNPPIPPLNGKTSGPAIWDPKCKHPNFPEARGFYWWDEFHPTTVVHEFGAKKLINQVCREVGRNSHSKRKKSVCKTSKAMQKIKSNKSKSSKDAQN